MPSSRPQLSLFSGTAGPDPTGPAAIITPQQRALAARLSPSLFLGTSSWTYPGWGGLLYAGHPGKEKLVDQGLLAYARHPLLRTACVDRTYHAPMRAADWLGYAQQVPADFRFVTKAWSEVTIACFPDHPRYAERAGQPNPRFLDPQLALDEVVRPYLDGAGAHAGPLVFELSPIPEHYALSEQALHARLTKLFEAMPRDLPIAVELRTQRFLTPRYLELLRAHGVGHVLNFWTGMPTPGHQAALGADALASDLVFRLMLPPGRAYEVLRAAYEPFDRLHEPQDAMRAEVTAITQRALDRGQRVFVIVGNKAEGCAPLTAFALAEMIAGAQS